MVAAVAVAVRVDQFSHVLLMACNVPSVLWMVMCRARQKSAVFKRILATVYACVMLPPQQEQQMVLLALQQPWKASAC
jgi:hypothetical protein